MREGQETFIDHSEVHPGTVIYNTETGLIGIVGRVQENPKCLFVPVSLDSGGKFAQLDLAMLPDACRPATQEEKFALQQEFNKAHLVWDAHKRRVLENKLELSEGTYVRVSTLGENQVSGVFKEFDAEGRIVLYYWADKNQNISYSMHEVIGSREYYQIQVIGSHARNMLNAALAKNGLEWNSRRQCLEHISSAVDSGEPGYYYIDDFMEIHKVMDTHKANDHKRITVGNYFATQEEAEEVRDCFLAILRIKSRAASPGVRKKRK